MKINFVEIEIGDQKIKLTLKQVAELKKILAEAFPEPETKTVFVPGPERVVEKPIYPYKPTWAPDHKWGQWEVTCNSNSLKLAANDSKIG